MYDDLCIIDDEYYFIRGCIELPVMDANGSFIWDVWVSLSEANYNKTMNTGMQREERECLSQCLVGYQLPFLV